MSTSPESVTGYGALRLSRATVTVSIEDGPVETKLLSWSKIRITDWVTKFTPERELPAGVKTLSLVAAP